MSKDFVITITGSTEDDGVLDVDFGIEDPDDVIDDAFDTVEDAMNGVSGVLTFNMSKEVS